MSASALLALPSLSPPLATHSSIDHQLPLALNQVSINVNPLLNRGCYPGGGTSAARSCTYLEALDSGLKYLGSNGMRPMASPTQTEENSIRTCPTHTANGFHPTSTFCPSLAFPDFGLTCVLPTPTPTPALKTSLLSYHLFFIISLLADKTLSPAHLRSQSLTLKNQSQPQPQPTIMDASNFGGGAAPRACYSCKLDPCLNLAHPYCPGLYP